MEVDKVIQANICKEKRKRPIGSIRALNFRLLLQRMLLRADCIRQDNGVGRVLRWAPRFPPSGVYT